MISDEEEARTAADQNLQDQIDAIGSGGGGSSDVEVLNDLEDVDTSKIDPSAVVVKDINHNNYIKGYYSKHWSFPLSYKWFYHMKGPVLHQGQPENGESFDFRELPTNICWGANIEDGEWKEESTAARASSIAWLESLKPGDAIRVMDVDPFHAGPDKTPFREIIYFKSWHLFKSTKHAHGTATDHEFFVMETYGVSELCERIKLGTGHSTNYDFLLETVEDEFAKDILFQYSLTSKKWEPTQPNYARREYVDETFDVLEYNFDESQGVQDSQINALETQLQLLAHVKAVGSWSYKRNITTSLRPPSRATFYGTHKGGATDKVLEYWSDAKLLMIDKTDLEGTTFTFSSFEPGDKLEILAKDGSSACFGTITNDPNQESYGNMTIAVERSQGGPAEDTEYLISAYRPGSNMGNVDLETLDERYLIKGGDTMKGAFGVARGNPADKDKQFQVAPNSGDHSTNVYAFNGGDLRFRTAPGNDTENYKTLLNLKSGGPKKGSVSLYGNVDVDTSNGASDSGFRLKGAFKVKGDGEGLSGTNMFEAVPETGVKYFGPVTDDEHVVTKEYFEENATTGFKITTHNGNYYIEEV